MTAKLYQQVNLFQPIFRKQRLVLSAAVLAPSIGVFVLALAAISTWGWLQVSSLEAEALLLEGRERAQSAQLASLDPASGLNRRAEIEAELVELNQRLIEQQRLVEVLDERPLGGIAGFSGILAALGRQRTPGLWLTRIDIDGASGGIELAGRSVSPDRVPGFLLSLGDEPALAGRRFDAFGLERDPDGEIGFRVASRAVGNGGPADGGRR